MADLTTTPVLSVCATVGSKLDGLAVKDGQLIFVRDKHKIALDFGGKRTIYHQIEELSTESVRTSMLAPVTGSFYFVLETGVLWSYQEGWVQITTAPKDTSSFPLDTRCRFTSLALAKAAAASAGEVGSTSTYWYGMKLLVDDGVYAKWYTIQRDKTLLGEASEFTTNETLILENGVLRVNTTNLAEQNNTLPITSAGVYTQLGNISILLDTI